MSGVPDVGGDGGPSGATDAGTAGGLKKFIGLRTATALVIANIIGAGIFTTTGFQIEALGRPGPVFALWIVGGILAFCGAVCYGELGAAIPRAGGEYAYLRRAFGPSFGFMSAFVSLVAGFSAPVAAAVKGMVGYAGGLFPALASEDAATLRLVIEFLVIWSLVAIHARSALAGFRFNDFVTLFKVVGIAGIIIAAFCFGAGDAANLARPVPGWSDPGPADTASAFATSLIFVMFCYLGWNASAYVAAEMKNPARDLPASLLLGTAVVTVLYLALNAVYFYGASAGELAGRVEVGLVSGEKLFGPGGVRAVTVIICVSMLASASAMTAAGPRVYYALGRDYGGLAFLARTRADSGAPVFSLLLQGAVTSLIALTGSVDQIQQYAGFTLTLFSSLAVAGVMVLRRREPDLPRPYRARGYPFTPLLFLGASAWTMVWAMRGRPGESSLGLLTVIAGGVLMRWIVGVGDAPASGDVRTGPDGRK